MPQDLPDHVTAYQDRHGTTRYRFRKKGLPSRSLPGQPGEERFELVYREAQAGLRSTKPRHASAIAPRTFRAAWLEVKLSADFQQLRPSSIAQQVGVAERFLREKIEPDGSMTFGQATFDGFTRAKVKKILARYGDRPHAGEAVLRFIRKISLAALDLEWITTDPTYRVKYRPKIIGHRAWTDAELAQYEAHWPLGSRERLCYALALYTGQRCHDLAAMRWSAFDGKGIAVVQEKTGAPLWIPAHTNLASALTITDRSHLAIVCTHAGQSFSTKGFGNMMADAIEGAGLPDDCVLHGIRKSSGRCLAEAGATTRQIMAILGHKTLSEAENYTRDVEQRRLAEQAMAAWSHPRLAIVIGGK